MFRCNRVIAVIAAVIRLITASAALSQDRAAPTTDPQRVEETQPTVFSLLDEPNVRRELGIEGDQLQRVSRVVDEAKHFDPRVSLDELARLSEQGRGEYFRRKLKEAKDFYSAKERELEEILSKRRNGKGQWDRLREILRQRLGAAALLLPDVAKKLNIAPDKKNQIRRAIQEHASEDDVLTVLQNEKVLAPKDVQTFKSMKGATFTF